ncbi:hypothetical protein BXZ70DRAFT_1062554 [Cristinia sonorae]|uniref:Uncharacterized protein n=1 Tax=Cristinia sonorae TaxID=1940300 RepID=A0A8K0XT83_9AGAR|nr:hypothetical protein BXZ70DRAFT_1062554 [Cristinia sonorae]
MFFPASSVLLLATTVTGLLVNRTIDDQYGDEVTGQQVAYSGMWNQGNDCTWCAYHPNASLAHNGTWHDGLYVPSHDDPLLTFSFSFNGTAVYIFNILTRLTQTNVGITLDGKFMQNYTKFQNVSVFEQYQYNVPIFAMDGIPFGEHTVTVTSGGSVDDLILFDYAIYTTDVDQLPAGGANGNPKSHKLNIGAIVGGSIGGVGLLIFALIAWWLYRRHHAQQNTTVKEPFMQEPRHHSHPIPPPRIPPTNLSTTSDQHSEKTSSVMDISRTRSPTVPSLAGDQSSATDDRPPVSPSDDGSSSEAAMQQQLNFFRSELERLRARASTQPSRLKVVRSDSSSRRSERSGRSIGSSGRRSETSSAAVASLANELAKLRAEMTELKSLQGGSSPVTGQSPSSSEDLQRELFALRGEIDELRFQHLGPLPEYTPPPSSRHDIPQTRPLPPAPGHS